MTAILCRLLGHRDEIYGHDLGQPGSHIGQSKHRCTRCGKTWLVGIHVFWD